VKTCTGCALAHGIRPAVADNHCTNQSWSAALAGNTHPKDYYLRNPLRYAHYRAGCGRDARLKQLWGSAPE